MATEKDILEQMTVEQLDGFLRREVYGTGVFMLSTIYRICTILSVREPTGGAQRISFWSLPATMPIAGFCQRIKLLPTILAR